MSPSCYRAVLLISVVVLSRAYAEYLAEDALQQDDSCDNVVYAQIGRPKQKLVQRVRIILG